MNATDKKTATEFNAIANDVNTKNHVSTNVQTKAVNQKMQARKEAASELNVKFMSAKNRIDFMNSEKKLPAFAAALTANNLTMKDITVQSLLHCFSKITVKTTNSNEKAFRFKLIKKTEANVHVQKSDFLKFFTNEEVKSETVETLTTDFSVLDVNYKIVETSNEIYFVKNEIEYTMVLISDFSKLSFLQIMSKIAIYKERKANFDKKQLLTAQLEAEKAQTVNDMTTKKAA